MQDVKRLKSDYRCQVCVNLHVQLFQRILEHKEDIVAGLMVDHCLKCDTI